MNYNFVQPFLKQSTKIHEITDEQNKVIGGVQRFYRSKFQFLVDLVFDNFFLNIKVYDEKSNIRVQAVQKLTIIRDFWDIYENNKKYTLQCITKIKTNPRYIFFYNNKKFLIYKGYMDKYIRIKDCDTDKIISEYEYKTLIPPRKVSIRILDPIIDIYLSICLYLILSTKYS
ncbi:hypothetical protein [Parageobacillus thermoglucosidasius]|uniref:tubby C-terminal domain-like protein n=1 Tax=Parageobacillus thermoglucosidasius TaxID=1426 RepID=UPI000E1B1589|nr:hypothetical protein [Parageobacillus thermoglucosidasius]MED4905392.1 hypothetical protein [Parageobacillus thermoglucosidasius]MED4913791.1 hypothetical protein [Parageobacillus thermoglucosidasius]MED4946140.1 hypothetical protein [Parageobacillus thermoglucosidasius]MED4984001.1 hypothetical protein [Parageobacillus thermoglucosidasius]RDE18593.1 hypothetical protein DV714_20575 [Parageobacillus thermoglucosidasius]